MENRLVLDTHVWISIFHKNREVDLIDAIPAKSLLLISCDEQLKEIKHIASTNDKVKQMLSSKPDEYIRFVRGITQLSESTKRFSLLHDYKDNYLVDLCIQSHCTLVSDDVGFSSLKKMKRPKVKIISKKDFYHFLEW